MRCWSLGFVASEGYGEIWPWEKFVSTGLGVTRKGMWTNRKTCFVPRRNGRANLAADVAIVVMLSEDGLKRIEAQRWLGLGFFSRGGALIMYRDFQPCPPPCDTTTISKHNLKTYTQTADGELRYLLEWANNLPTFIPLKRTCQNCVSRVVEVGFKYLSMIRGKNIVHNTLYPFL